MMKLIKSVLAIAMALAMAMSLLPMSVMADDGDITEENDASVRVQELLNALPETVTAENAAEVETLLGEIDSLTDKLELSDEQWAVYEQANTALDELANNDDSEPENEPETVYVDVDVDKGEEATKKTYMYSGTTYYYIELTNTSFKVGNKNTPITTKVASLSVEGSEIEEYYDTETREGEGYAIARRWYSVQKDSSYKYTEENAPTNENKPIGDGEVGLVASDYKEITINKTTYSYVESLSGMANNTYTVVWDQVKIFSSGLHVKGYVVLSNEPDEMVEDVYLVLGLENTIATNGDKVTGAKVSGSNTSWYWLGAAEGTGSVTGSLPDTETGKNATIITKNLDNKEEYGINLSCVEFPTIVANRTTYSYDTEGTKKAGTYSLEPTELKAHKANDNCGHIEGATQLHWHMGYRAVLNDGSKAKYTVTFKSNGATYGTKSVTNGEVVTAPETNPVLPGYTFSGWVTKDGEAYDFNSAVTEDITLTAEWTPIQYWTPTVTPQTPADNTDNTDNADNTDDSSTEDETIIDIEEDDTPLSPTPDTEPATDTDESVNLEDEDVPMAELPDEETSPAEPSYEEASLTDISGEDTPLAEVPVTGDSLMVWILLAGVSGIALVLLTFTEKKRKKDRAA